MMLAALAVTLDLYLQDPLLSVPIWRMIATTPAFLEARATQWKDRLETLGISVELKAGASTVGGGSLPGERLATTLVALNAPKSHANAVLARLRERPVPVFGRVEAGQVVLDPRTVLPGEDEALLEAVRAALT